MSLFNIFFKIPQASQETLREVENYLFQSFDSETPEDIETNTFHKDEDREFHIVKNIIILHLTKEQPIMREQVYIRGFKEDRILDPIKIYKEIIQLFRIGNSAPKLKQALKSKDLDLFFRLLLNNDYSFKSDDSIENYFIYLSNSKVEIL